jgi:hypothetical protein
MFSLVRQTLHRRRLNSSADFSYARRLLSDLFSRTSTSSLCLWLPVCCVDVLLSAQEAREIEEEERALLQEGGVAPETFYRDEEEAVAAEY